MPQFLGTWWVLGGFLTLLALGAFCVGNLVVEDKGERIHRQNSDRELENLISSYAKQWQIVSDTLTKRIIELENPPVLKDQRENRTCPECGQEKEIRMDDYLCDDCREPEKIAA
jgi:hypothetical protein